MTPTRADPRFEFGENWARFLTHLNDERIAVAEASLCEWLSVTNLSGLRFLDVGSGSGLFSLAARRLGARVHSFDYDSRSVACTNEVRRRYSGDDGDWIVERGDALDEAWLTKLGRFDVVYAWGVLHHTGNMWRALDLVVPLLAPQGKLFIAIYNDQGRKSRAWRLVKRAYNALPGLAKLLLLIPSMMAVWGPAIARDLVIGKPFDTLRTYARRRGMSPWQDLVDWVGGFPFEVARPEEVFDFLRDRGLVLTKLATCAGALGCNQFVFVAPASHGEATGTILNDDAQRPNPTGKA